MEKQIWNPTTGKFETQSVKNGDVLTFDQYATVNPNATKTNTGAFGEAVGLGKLNTSGSEPSMWDTFSGYFTPNEKGVSQAGSVMDTIGSGIKGAVGLGSLYFAKKNYDLEKDQQEYLKDIDKQNAARASKFAANAGNNASY